ncbi:MAG: glycosyltransferase family 2 protein [Planctomycetota bacterium]|jgi:dolichol-phosphate mannosyltransferase
MATRTGISVVVPLLDEEEVLPQLHRRLVRALEDIGESFEVLFVDDGSTDETPEQLAELCRKDPRIKALLLSRNFGHQMAITAGLTRTRGDCVAVMDGDLQDPPELLPEMYQKLQSGYDVAFAVRTRRRGSVAMRTLYWAYYRLARVLEQVHVPMDAGDFCMMSRRVVDVLNAMPERRRYVRGLRAWVGFRQCSVGYVRDERSAGEPKYSFTRLVRLGLDGIFTMSERPLRLATMAGLLISGGAFLYVVRLILWRIFSGQTPEGFATIAVAILFLGGLQLISLGIIGEYIGRIHSEVKGRPTFITRKEINFEKEERLDPQGRSEDGEA